MAFVKKTWKDRISEEPQRRLLTPTDGSDPIVVDVARREGTVTQEGDAFSAANMNDLEERIERGMGAGDILIAGTESTAIASKAYIKGQYLIYNSLLYRVTAAIAKNASLVPNTNIVATKAADEISNHLTVSGREFYFDYQNGEYGYNTSASRGADTFFPFKQLTITKIVDYYSNGGSYTNNSSKTQYAIFAVFKRNEYSDGNGTISFSTTGTVLNGWYSAARGYSNNGTLEGRTSYSYSISQSNSTAGCMGVVQLEPSQTITVSATNWGENRLCMLQIIE